MAVKKLHFLGITGHAMRGLAQAAIDLGYEVTGTDPGGKPPGSDWLDSHSITWWREPAAEHLDGVEMLIISGGSVPDDLEIVTAQQRKIPVVSYAEFVATLIKTKRRIVVAGTHGKTTTTSLITWLLESAGRHPDYLIGIQPRNFDTSVRLSDSPVIVLEGDEYKASALDDRSKFSFYKPDVMVVTSLEMDHPDMFKSLDEIKQRFETVVTNMDDSGRLLYWSEVPVLSAMAKLSTAKAQSYGEHGVWRADHESFTSSGISFDLYEGDVYRDHFRIGLYGRHNVNNATAAIAVALGEGLSVDEIQHGGESFLGAARRFSMVSRPGAEVTVVDDYAHHPTEIATTIEAAKLHFDGRVIAIVRPHTYSRVTELLKEYRAALRTADIGFVTEIEAAREANLEHTVSGADIAKTIDNVSFEPDRTALVDQVLKVAKPGDIVLCMTVGGYENIAEELADRLA